jgi:hypothetical protein
VPKSRAHRSVLSRAGAVEPLDDENEKTTLWVRGDSAEFPLVPKERPLPLVPRERPSDSKAAFVLSKTLRPIAATLRWFPLAYVLSTAALVVAGLALYFARTAPNEPPRAAAAPSSSVEVAAPPSPAPPPPVPPPPAPSASVVRAQPATTGKSPIDVMSLPIAPPASRPKPRGPSAPAAGN